MKTQSMRALLGGLASIAIGVSALPAGASIIAADGFNYIPSGVSLVTANGGTPLPPATVGWSSAWAADAGATVGPGLTYNYNGIPNIGIGNSVTLGDSITTAGINSRRIHNIHHAIRVDRRGHRFHQSDTPIGPQCRQPIQLDNVRAAV